MAWPKGKNHPRLGKHHSEETKRKISKAKMGTQMGNQNARGNRSNTGRAISEDTKKKHSKAISGYKNHRWKGGKFTDTNGYIFILKAGHPYSQKSGYISEHRLIAEKHLGRHLKPNETMHHRNGKRDDNRWHNLFIFESQSDHIRYERFLRREINA